MVSKKEKEKRRNTGIIIGGSAVALGIILLATSSKKVTGVPSGECLTPREKDPNTGACKCGPGFVDIMGNCVEQIGACGAGNVYNPFMKICEPIQATTGTFELTSDPEGATIFIDGNEMSELTASLSSPSPTIISLNQGTYDIEIRKTGYYSEFERITITGGMTTIRSYSLIPNPEAANSVYISTIDVLPIGGRNGDPVQIDVNVTNTTQSVFNGFLSAKFIDPASGTIFFTQIAEIPVSIPAGQGITFQINAIVNDMGVAVSTALNVQIILNTQLLEAGELISTREGSFALSPTDIGPVMTCPIGCDLTTMFLGCDEQSTPIACVESCPPGMMVNPLTGQCETPLNCSPGTCGMPGVFDPMTWSCNCPPGCTYDEVLDQCDSAAACTCPLTFGAGQDIEVDFGGTAGIRISCSGGCDPQTTSCEYDIIGTPESALSCTNFTLVGGESGTIRWYLLNNNASTLCVRSRAIVHEWGNPGNVIFMTSWSMDKNIAPGVSRIFVEGWTAPPAIGFFPEIDISIEIECPSSGTPVGGLEGGFSQMGLGFGGTE